MRTGQKLYEKARTLMPGGTQLLSKRPEMFLPEQWPAYYSKAKGAEVWDLDGNRYIDASIAGVSTSLLGYADPDVEEAVIRAVQAGPMSTLNCPEEVELAELLIELHPWAEMVRYARAGGEVLAMAIRIARAASGRQRIAFCGYHGWHDWYLSTNLAAENALSGHLLAGLAPAGVPEGLTGTTLPFRYNRIEELRKIVAEHGGELAAIVMEPIRDVDPAPGFLEEVRALATRTGAALIFDEVSCAWRMNTGGIHLVYGVNPDLAAFAKAMSNGYAMAALIGTRAVMDAAQQTFISSTYWTERIGPTAALATIRKHRREVVPKHLAEIGTQVRAIWREAAGAAGLAIAIGGLLPASTFALQSPDAPALATLFVQEMLDRGFLATTKFNAMFAHRAVHLEQYRTAVNQVFPLLAEAASHGDVMARLRGPVKHSDFQRLT